MSMDSCGWVMSTPRIGELFAGYGGLGMGVQAVFGGEVAWYSEIDKGALKILTHRFPGVPNVGDVTTADWSTVEPVDILTGGSPCQDLSHAGKRAGMTEGTRSNLWVAMREAIAQLRPPTVVWENVRGAYSACADSEMGRCPRCVDPGAPGGHDPRLRALGRVLGDLSELGYDASWHGLRAADVGAPHGRFRVFVIATDARCIRGREGWTARPGEAQGGRAFGDVAGRGLLPTPRATRGGSHTETVSLLPTPRATDGTKGGPNQRGSSGDLMLPSAVAGLLPTPTARDFKNAGDPAKTAGRMAERGQPLSEVAVNHINGHGKSLAIETQRLLQTPSVSDASGGHANRGGDRAEELLLPGQARAMHGQNWGTYAPAIARWEHILDRPAPAPTMTSTKGNPQLNPVFVEWMMGLSAGWVTDVPGITRNEALRALGNGVVRQQCAAALRTMRAWEMVA